MTVVMVTHETDIARNARRTVIMRDGRVVLDRPVAHRRVASEELVKLQSAGTETDFAATATA